MKTSNNAAGQPKRTLLTGFPSFDYMAQDYTPKYLDTHLYCHSIDKKHLSKGFLPRCQLLEQIYKDTTVSDMFFPPTFPEPVQSKSHSDYKLAAISQLISYLNWWVQEKVACERPVFWFYAYSYIPCQRRVAFASHILDDLITEFNFSHQTAIAEELKKLASNLNKKAIEWDGYARIRQQSEYWIDPSRLNPITVKGAAAALLGKLRHIGSMDREEKQSGEKANSQPEKPSAKAKVLAALIEHPDWSNTKIAKEAGINRTTLYDYPEFKTARKVQKQNKGKIPRGSKSQDGTIEATDE